MDLEPCASVEVAPLVQCCKQRLGLVVDDADVEALIDQARHRAGVDPSLCHSVLQRSSALPPVQRGVSVGVFCQHLATCSTSANNLQGVALTPFFPPSSPWSSSHDHPLQSYSFERSTPCARYPRAYAGCTPIEIVTRFKDPALFPWHRLPEASCGRRFEELCQLAEESHHVAIEVVELLTDPTFDRPRPCAGSPAAGKA